MMNEINKQKYQQLKFQIIDIQKNINELQTYHNELKQKMEKTILIDEKLINYDDLNLIETTEKEIMDNLQIIIKSIDQKINE